MRAEYARAGDVRLSALVLATNDAGSFMPRLEYRAEKGGIAHLEVYGVTTAMSVSATFELCASASGPVLATVAGRVATSSVEDARTVTGAFSVAAIPAGEYLMRAVVMVNGARVGVVTRTLRKQ
jgi:hypothetical protein